MYTKKAFTLLELMVVLIIVATLASLAIAQYGRSVEKSRGAEAKEVIGVLRGLALAYWNEHETFMPPAAITNADLNIGPGVGMIPSVARSSHYFTYSWTLVFPTIIRFTATRCSGGACKDTTSWGGQMIRLSVGCPDGTGGWDYAAGAVYQ